MAKRTFSASCRMLHYFDAPIMLLGRKAQTVPTTERTKDMDMTVHMRRRSLAVIS